MHVCGPFPEEGQNHVMVVPVGTVPSRSLENTRFGTETPTVFLNDHAFYECDLKPVCQIIGKMRTRIEFDRLLYFL